MARYENKERIKVPSAIISANIGVFISNKIKFRRIMSPKRGKNTKRRINMKIKVLSR